MSAELKPTGWAAQRDRYAVPVLFNPYTGEPRDARDVQSDPQGALIVPPGKVEMLAALAAPSQPAEPVKCAHCGRSPGADNHCDWIECAALSPAEPVAQAEQQHTDSDVRAEEQFHRNMEARKAAQPQEAEQPRAQDERERFEALAAGMYDLTPAPGNPDLYRDHFTQSFRNGWLAALASRPRLTEGQLIAMADTVMIDLLKSNRGSFRISYGRAIERALLGDEKESR